MLELIEKVKLAIENSEKYAHLVHVEIELAKTTDFETYNKLSEQLKSSMKCNLGNIIGSARIAQKHAKEDLKLYDQDKFNIPHNVETFLNFSQWTNSPFFGEGVEFGLTSNKLILDLVADGSYPDLMRRFLVLGTHEHGEIGVWLYDDEVEDSEILLFDHDDETIQILSHSMKNFLKRALTAYTEEVTNNWFSPSKTLTHIIREIDGDDIYPSGSVYRLDSVDQWPEHWQKIRKKKKIKGNTNAASQPQIIATRIFEVNGTPALTVDFYKPQRRDGGWYCEYRILGGIMRDAEFREQNGADSLEALMKAIEETRQFLTYQQKQVGESISWQGSADLHLADITETTSYYSA